MKSQLNNTSKFKSQDRDSNIELLRTISIIQQLYSLYILFALYLHYLYSLCWLISYAYYYGISYYENYMKNINNERILAWCVFILFTRFLLDRLSAIHSIIIGKTILDYRPFDVSDWLINYEGGFIRRGILGQILWELEQWHLYDVRIAITLICFVTSITLTLFPSALTYLDSVWLWLCLQVRVSSPYSYSVGAFVTTHSP